MHIMSECFSKLEASTLPILNVHTNFPHYLTMLLELPRHESHVICHLFYCSFDTGLKISTLLAYIDCRWSHSVKS